MKVMKDLDINGELARIHIAYKTELKAAKTRYKGYAELIFSRLESKQRAQKLESIAQAIDEHGTSS